MFCPASSIPCTPGEGHLSLLLWTWTFLRCLWRSSVMSPQAQSSSAICPASLSISWVHFWILNLHLDHMHHIISLSILFQYTQGTLSYFSVVYILVNRKALWHLYLLGHTFVSPIQTYHLTQLAVCIFFLMHPGPLGGYRSSCKSLLY